MNFYKISFIGKLNGAIGVSYGHTKNVWAKDEKSARLKLYETHEHIHNTMITILITTGTLSEGTLEASHLYPVFKKTIDTLDPKHENSTDWPTITDERRFDSDGVNDFDIPDMIADLGTLAPEGYTFGPHPSDGADFGFWNEWLFEKPLYVKEVKGMRVAKYTNDEGQIKLAIEKKGQTRNVAVFKDESAYYRFLDNAVDENEAAFYKMSALCSLMSAMIKEYPC